MMQNVLFQKKCMPCEGSSQPLRVNKVKKLIEQIPTWKLDDTFLQISKTFSFSTFMNAIEFVTKVAALAEEENHHPNIKISYRKVTLTCTTHAVHGLSENDFIMAAKIDKII